MRASEVVKMSKKQKQECVDSLLCMIEIVGSQTEFSRIIGANQSQVSRWLSGLNVPAERAVYIEKKLGISRCTLRPDLFKI